MTTPTPQYEDFAARLKDVPEVIRRCFLDDTTEQQIREIAQSNRLPKAQGEPLSFQTWRVLLGFVRYEDFSKELAIKLGIDSRSAQIITEQITQAIFAPVKESFDQVQMRFSGNHGGIPSSPPLSASLKDTPTSTPANLPATNPKNSLGALAATPDKSRLPSPPPPLVASTPSTQPDPLMPHKPRPIPHVQGNVISLKRDPNKLIMPTRP